MSRRLSGQLEAVTSAAGTAVADRYRRCANALAMAVALDDDLELDDDSVELVLVVGRDD